MNVLPLLIEKGLLKPEDARAVEDDVRGGSTMDAALEKHGVAPDAVLAAVSARYGIPTRSLGPEEKIGEAALAYIPEESARHYRFVPLTVKDGALEVGIIDPDNIEAMDALQFISSKIGVPYKLFLITQADFDRIIEEYGNISGEVGEALTEFEGAADAETPLDKKRQEREEAAAAADALQAARERVGEERAVPEPARARLASALSAGKELSQAENCCFSQKKHLPQAITNGTTTRSPVFSVEPGPVSSTTPMNSWPRMSPLCMPGM